MENVIEQSELLVVEPFPDHRDSCRSADHREEKDCTEQGNSLDLSVQKYRKEQRNYNAQRHFNDGVLNRIDQRLYDFRICECLCIIGKSYKSIAFSEITGLTERLIYRINGRIKVQDDQFLLHS